MKLSQKQIINHLKEDKDRVIKDLNFIKAEVTEDLPTTIETLRDFGFDVADNGMLKMITPGGFFRFPVVGVDRIKELVQKYYPADLLPYKDVYKHPSGYNFWWSLNGACRMRGATLYFPMPESDNIHNYVEALKSGNKGLIELFAKALDMGQVAQLTKDTTNA